MSWACGFDNLDHMGLSIISYFPKINKCYSTKVPVIEHQVFEI